MQIFCMVNINHKASLAGFADRLADCAKAFGGKDKLAESSGTPRRTFGDYLAGKTPPKLDRILAISRASGYSIHWLATGEGPKLARPNHSGAAATPETLKSNLVDPDAVTVAVILTVEDVLKMGRMPPPEAVQAIFLDHLERANDEAATLDTTDLLERITSAVRGS